MANRSDERSRPEDSPGDRTSDRGRADDDIRGGSDERLRSVADDDEDEFEEVETEDDESDDDR